MYYKILVRPLIVVQIYDTYVSTSLGELQYFVKKYDLSLLSPTNANYRYLCC